MNNQNDSQAQEIPVSNSSSLQMKAAQLAKQRKLSANTTLFSALGLLVGFGLCAGGSFDYGLIILGIAAIIFTVSITSTFSTSWHLSYVEKQIKGGVIGDITPARKALNVLLSLILAFITAIVVGFGLCFGIASLGNF